MKKNILLLLFTLLFVTSLYSQQAAIRIGYVDSQVILQQLPEAQKIQKELDNLLQKYQSEYDQMVKTYQSKIEEYQKKEAMLNPQAKEQMQREIAIHRVSHLWVQHHQTHIRNQIQLNRLVAYKGARQNQQNVLN